MMIRWLIQLKHAPIWNTLQKFMNMLIIIQKNIIQDLLKEINALGIGPQGFGGRTTCLGLSIETAPTHVAGLPVAVNVSCHVTRRASAQL